MQGDGQAPFPREGVQAPLPSLPLEVPMQCAPTGQTGRQVCQAAQAFGAPRGTETPGHGARGGRPSWPHACVACMHAMRHIKLRSDLSISKVVVMVVNIYEFHWRPERAHRIPRVLRRPPLRRESTCQTHGLPSLCDMRVFACSLVGPRWEGRGLRVLYMYNYRRTCVRWPRASIHSFNVVTAGLIGVLRRVTTQSPSCHSN